MNHYRQPIILFGIVLPFIACAALIGGLGYLRTKVKASFDEKMAGYTASNQTKQAAQVIEAEVSRQQPHFARWKTSLAEETRSAITANFRNIQAGLPPKEFQQTAFDTPPGTTGFGAVSKQKSSQVRIAFRGTFRTLQRAFADLETRMPQLQLEELRIEPIGAESSQLNLQVSYTAWEL